MLAIAWRAFLWDARPMPATMAVAAVMVASHWMLLAALAGSLRARLRRRAPASTAAAADV